MSLEDTLKENTEALRENSALLKQVIGMAPGGGGAAGASAGDTSGGSDEEQPARKRGEPSPGKKRRTAAEVKEDEEAEAREKAAQGGGSDDSGNDDGNEDHISFADLKTKLAAWLGEFSKEEDKNNPDGTHPEVTARREALKKVLKSDKVGVEKLPELEADDKGAARDVVINWLETKAKPYDNGHGKGRLVADPEPADDGDDDGLGV